MSCDEHDNNSDDGDGDDDDNDEDHDDGGDDAAGCKRLSTRASTTQAPAAHTQKQPRACSTQRHLHQGVARLH